MPDLDAKLDALADALAILIQEQGRVDKNPKLTRAAADLRAAIAIDTTGG